MKERAMAQDTWLDSADNWNTPSDWSAGLPGPSSDVVINRRGNPQVTASFGTVNSIRISGRRPELTFINAGASSVTGNVTLGNVQGGFGYLSLDPFGGGGSTLTIGGKLNIVSGQVVIDYYGYPLSAPATIEAGKACELGPD
jgi:hypothetical protein